MARHRAVAHRPRWRHPPTPAAIPAQRRAGIEVVDALTKLAHLVSADELAAGWVRGDYHARCGARFQAASLVEPGRGRCQGCAS
ncbi:MAG: hypothetical protein ACRDRX_18105 [Pseudonocardiaceae bacterium]